MSSKQEVCSLVTVSCTNIVDYLSVWGEFCQLSMRYKGQQFQYKWLLRTSNILCTHLDEWRVVINIIFYIYISNTYMYVYTYIFFKYIHAYIIIYMYIFQIYTFIYNYIHVMQVNIQNPPALQYDDLMELSSHNGLQNEIISHNFCLVLLI